MEVDYVDPRMRELEGPDALSESKLPLAVIESFKRKLVLLRAAPDERTLRNWKSFHYEKLVGDRKGQRSIRINKQWRLCFLLDSEVSPQKIRILSIEDYH